MSGGNCLNVLQFTQLLFEEIHADGWAHLPVDKMAATFTDGILKHIFLNENIRISIQFSLRFVPKGPIDNIQVLVWIMAWRWIDDKPLSEPMLTQFTDAYMRH